MKEKYKLNLVKLQSHDAVVCRVCLRCSLSCEWKRPSRDLIPCDQTITTPPLLHAHVRLFLPALYASPTLTLQVLFAKARAEAPLSLSAAVALRPDAPRVQHAPVQSVAGAAVQHYGGVRWAILGYANAGDCRVSCGYAH